MDSPFPTNPYAPNLPDPSLAPFAGRKTALARLYQQIADPTRREAVAYVGWRDVGKSALLRHISTVFDETFVGVYIPLQSTPIENETDWLLTLAQGATAEVLERNFTLHRLSNLPAPEGDPRAWFADVFLLEMMSVIRPHRRLVYLLDDAERLLDAGAEARLPADHFAYLHSLLARFTQLEFVLTLHAGRENEFANLRPLVDFNTIHRLTHLDAEESAWLLQTPVADLYRVPDTTAEAVHRATGGAPDLLNLYGDALYRRWEAMPELNVVTVDDVKAITPLVYRTAAHNFRRIWGELSVNERLVLSAISGLQYDDPLRPIPAAAIETWLVETDDPLDITAINAALRSLEYRELVMIVPSGVTLNAGLFQAWLLENARLDQAQSPAPVITEDVGTPARGLRGRAAWIAVAAFVLLVVLGLYVIVTLSNLPREDSLRNVPAPPTVTLAPSQ